MYEIIWRYTWDAGCKNIQRGKTLGEAFRLLKGSVSPSFLASHPGSALVRVEIVRCDGRIVRAWNAARA